MSVKSIIPGLSILNCLIADSNLNKSFKLISSLCCPRLYCSRTEIFLDLANSIKDKCGLSELNIPPSSSFQDAYFNSIPQALPISV